MSLTEIRNKHCDKCELHSKAKTVCVMGSGSFKQRVFIVGEAPGFQEDHMGRPFVGKAGKLLRSELIRVEIQPETLYLTNAVKCFPHGTPRDDELETCSKNYLKKEIELLKPDWIMALGSKSFQVLTKSKETITNARGMLWDCKLGSHEAFVFPLFHPAYILRRQNELPTFQSDLELFAATIKL